MPSKVSTKKPKDPNAPKAALSSYFIFSNERRRTLMQEHTDKKITEISKMISAEWKSISEDTKAKYQAQAAQLKEEYKIKLEEYKQTDNYKSHQVKISEWQQRVKDSKNPDLSNSSSHGNHNIMKGLKLPRKPKDSCAPKKPPSSYFLFAQQIREEVKKEHPQMKITEISKVLGAKWKQLDESSRALYSEQAKQLKEQYNKDIAAYKESDDYKTFQQTLQNYEQECTRRRAAYAAKQQQKQQQQQQLKLKSKLKSKKKSKQNKKNQKKSSKRKRRHSKSKMEESSSDESSSDESSSDDSDSGSSSSDSDSRSSSNGSDSDSDSGSDSSSGSASDSD